MKDAAADKHVIGATAMVYFPEFQWGNVVARVDTGAKISVLHCTKITCVQAPGGQELCFALEDGTGAKEFTTTVFKEKFIRNSFGVVEKRYVIRGLMVLEGRRLRGMFALANREKMTYPVLIGRNFLRGRFVVDVARTSPEAGSLLP